MCGRYFFQLDNNIPAMLRTKIEQLSIDDFQQGEIFPSQKALVLTKGIAHDYQASIQTWGIQSAKGKLLINARMEGIEEKYTFRPLLRNRCVIVTNHFYEWVSHGNTKDKIAISKQAEPIFYMAGIYTPRKEFVIVTGEAYGAMKEIHKRTPILMNEEQMLSYLQEEQDYIIDNDGLEFQTV